MSGGRTSRVLVVDDEDFVRDSLAEILLSEGFAVETRADARSALAALAEFDVDVVLTDLRMPGRDGIDLIAEARARGVEVPVVVLTGMGTVERAVEAMKAGAFDFLEKPVEPERLLRLVRHALERRSLMTEIGRLKRTVRDLRAGRRLVGDSDEMRRVREQIAQVGATESTVLVTGESGTGKELVAEALHEASPRREGPLVRVNCAAIPEGLFESEFFGHRRGAFSGAVADRVGRFEEAEGGTLVLDEVGTLSAEGQAKLLRVLEGGEYQVVGESRSRRADSRIVAMTNDDLRRRVAAGAFRADLFYRLEVFPIRVPPLRDRRADVEPIATALIERIRGERPTEGSPAEPLDQEAVAALVSYSWPGNVRELRNVLERALIICDGRTPDAGTLRQILEAAITSSGEGRPDGDDLHIRRNLDRVERELIEQALVRCGDRRKEAAELLGIDPRNLAYYMRKHGLNSRER